MKKFICIILLAVISSFIFASCAKEEVKPQTSNQGTTAPIKE